MLLREEIKQLAYIKWLNAKCPKDKDANFWLEAEKEVVDRRAQINRTNPFRANLHRRGL